MESTKFKVITITSVLTGLSLGGTMLSGMVYAEKVQDADSIAQAFGEKSFHNLELRLRHEGAKDKTLNTNYAGNAQELKSARLTSLRTSLTYGTGAVCDTSAQMTATNVATFLDTKKHNPIAGNFAGDQFNYTAINEPRGTALNELFVQNSSIPDTNIRVGNQFFTLDNGRFFGKNDYHQNPQSYRGLTITNNSIMDTTVTYGYIGNILTNNGTTRDVSRNNNQSTNLLHVNWHGVDWGKVSLYDYRIKDKGTPDYLHGDEIYSGNNYGLRFSGDTDIDANSLNVNYELEYAKQHGKYNNPINYHAHYWLAGLGATYNGFSAGLRHEVLSGKDGAQNEQFRFVRSGSDHDFLGKADVFNITPHAGVKDTMLRLGYKYEQWQFHLDGHVFKPQAGSGVRYGKETDFCVRYDFAEHYNVGLAYAKFKAKDGNLGNINGANAASALGDVAKYWLTLGASF